MEFFIDREESIDLNQTRKNKTQGVTPSMCKLCLALSLNTKARF